MKPVHCDVLNQVLADIVERIPAEEENPFLHLLEMANTPRSKQRLVQYILSCIVGQKFIAGSELSLSNQLTLQFDSNEANRHYGPWLGQYLARIGEIKALKPSTTLRQFDAAQIPAEVLKWAEESLTTDEIGRAHV